jgi:hypothetical protein
MRRIICLLLILALLFPFASGGDTTPPASITGLTNSTPYCGNITWSWTNPLDSDFNHTYVLKNNAFYFNYTNTTTTTLWAGLSNITQYNFSARTVDITGNINVTWVNKSAITAECDLAIPATPTPTPTPTVTATPTPMPTIAGSLEIPLCGRQDFFFYNASSEIAGHRLMKNYPELDGQRTIVSPSIDSTSGEVTLGTWILNSGVTETKMLAPGTWDFRPYFISSSDAGLTRSHIRVFNMSSAGNKTYFWFGNAVITDIGKTTVPRIYDIHYARRNYTSFFTGDRLGVQINVSTDSAAARTVTIELAGNTNASMFSNAYWLCPVTTATTTTTQIPTWQPIINPSTDRKLEWSLNGILYFLFGG